MQKETHFQSITVIPDGISLEDMLQREFFAGTVVGMHLVHDGSVSAKDLAKYAQLIAVTRFDPDKVHVAETVISDDKDRFFARKFEYKAIPHFAYLGLADDEIEAWTSSALISNNHPLARLDVPNAALLLTDNRGIKGGLLFRELRSFDATTSSFYVRLTAEDRPSALSEICTVFGKAQISMKNILQTQPTEDSPVADIGILFHPTLTATLYTALEKVQTTAACQSVDTVLKAFI